MNKALAILQCAAPVVIMVMLIPFVKNDYMLTFLYILIIGSSLFINKIKREVLIFTFGFFCMLFFETIFIRTGVETFVRNSLFGIMPLWLPFLWGYGFVVIKRGVDILGK